MMTTTPTAAAGTAAPKRLPQACKHPNYEARHLAEPHPDDKWDAVGLIDEAAGRGACCAIHYVRHLRYKFELV